MNNSNKVSPKMQQLCFKILDYIDSNPNTSTADPFIKFSEMPSPVVSLAIDLLFKHDLIQMDSNFTLSANQNYPFPTWPNKIKEIEFPRTSRIYDSFKSKSLTSPYKMGTLYGDIQYRELTAQDYLKSQEFYDYESLTLIDKIGENFFSRQFSALLADDTGEKETIVCIAENIKKNILGFVAITNFANYQDIGGTINIPKENIFTITFVATRKGAENHGIASNLLKIALTRLSARHQIEQLSYDPICDQSESVMKKVFNKNNFKLHKWKPEAQDYIKYGCYLRGYIITPTEPRKIFYQETETEQAQ